MRVEELQGAEETERRAKEKAAKAVAAEAAAEKKKATQARVERMKEWDDEEVRMLEKALEKFPQVWYMSLGECLNVGFDSHWHWCFFLLSCSWARHDG